MPKAGSRSHAGSPHVSRAVREDRDEREREPEARRGVHDGRDHGQPAIHDTSAPRRLNQSERNSNQKGQSERGGAEAEGHRERVGDGARDRLASQRALTEIAVQHAGRPPCILHGDRPVESELGANTRGVGRSRGRWNQEGRGITRGKADKREREREHQPEKRDRAGEAPQHGE